MVYNPGIQLSRSGWRMLTGFQIPAQIFNCSSVSVVFLLSCPQAEKNAFVVADLGALLQQHVLWQSTLPLVRPFYPVKCNSSPAVIEILAALGVGFVCANKVMLSWFTIPHWFICMIRNKLIFSFFFLIPIFPCISFRLKSQWYSTTMSLLRTSSCLVFANSSHTSSMLPRIVLTIWCVITRRNSEKSPVLTQMPSQFALASIFDIFILNASFDWSSVFGITLHLSSQAAPAVMHRGSNRGGKHGVWLLVEKLQASFRCCHRAGRGCGWSSVSLLFSTSITSILSPNFQLNQLAFIILQVPGTSIMQRP